MTNNRILPTNPAPQPLAMVDVPRVGDLVDAMQQDMQMVDELRRFYFGTNTDMFSSSWSTKVFAKDPLLQRRRLPAAGKVINEIVDRIEIKAWGVLDENYVESDQEVPKWVREADREMAISTEIANTLHLDAEIAAQSFALVLPNPDTTRRPIDQDGEGFTDDNENLQTDYKESAIPEPTIGPGLLTADASSYIIPLRAGEMIVSYQPGSRWPKWGARYVQNDPVTKDENKRDSLYVFTETEILTYKGKGISNDDWSLEETWPYPPLMRGICPIVPFTIESFLNPQSGIWPLIGCQAALDQLQMSDAAMIEFAGFPITYALLDKETNLENVMMMLDPKNGKNILDKSPDAFWQIVADQVGQLAPADPNVVLERCDFYIRGALSLGSIPQTTWTGTHPDQSGETIRQERESMISKINNRITHHAASWNRVWEIMARCRGVSDPRVYPRWVPPTARDKQHAVELALLMIQAGVPPEDALKGVVEDDVLERINMEQILGRERPDVTERPTEGSQISPGHSAPGPPRGNDDGPRNT